MPELSARHTTPRIIEDAEYVLMEFNGRSIQAKMYKPEPNFMVLAYTRVMMWSLLLTTRLNDVGVIGLGGGAIPKWLWHYFPGVQLQIAEPDERVIALAHRFKMPENDQRFNIVAQCGAAFAQQHQQAFDLLFVDAFDADGVPEKLQTKQFYSDIKHALKPAGIAVFNLHNENGDCVNLIHEVFAGNLCWIVNPFNSQPVVFAQSERKIIDRAALTVRAQSLETQTDSEFQPALPLFSPLQLYGTTQSIWYLGRQWPCRCFP